MLDTEVAHGGKQSLKLTNGTSFGAHIYGMLWRATPIRVEPGKTYTLSAWVKSESPGQVGLIGGGAWQIRAQAPVTGKDWQRIATTFTAGEGDRSNRRDKRDWSAAERWKLRAGRVRRGTFPKGRPRPSAA